MGRKTILIFGRAGQVGSALIQRLQNDHKVIALDQETHSFLDPSFIIEEVLNLAPDIIINAAAYTAVDKAESDFQTASLVNSATPIALGATACCLGAQFIHYSTDYVFDGTKRWPYEESDKVCPINAYGKTKAAADEGISQANKFAWGYWLDRCANISGTTKKMASNSHFLILRTSWVYDNKGANFYKKMLELAAREDLPILKVVSDQVGNPTPSYLIADMTVECLKQELALKQPGVYNLTTKGNTSWYGFAKKIFELHNIKKEVLPITTEEFKTPAKRPLNSVLDCTKLEKAIEVELPRWDAALVTTI